MAESLDTRAPRALDLAQSWLPSAVALWRPQEQRILTTSVGSLISSHFGLADDMPGWRPEGLGFGPYQGQLRIECASPVAMLA